MHMGAVDLERVAPQPLDARAHIRQNFQQQTHIGNIRHVFNAAHAVHQQCGRQHGDRGVFRARDRDRAVQGLSALYFILNQNKSLFIPVIC